MDVRRLRSGELVAGVGAAALAVAMFLDWFGGRSAWETLTVGRVLLVLTIALAATLVVITLRKRAVSMATSSATITVGVGALTLLYLLYRVGIDEPGRNGVVSIDAGAYLGVGCALAIVAGAWRALADERTGAAASLQQTESVLAVRGAPRPAPPSATRRAARRPPGSDPRAASRPGPADSNRSRSAAPIAPRASGCRTGGAPEPSAPPRIART